MTWADVLQACLALTTIASLGLALSLSPRLRRWSPIVGLIGQPFWIAYAIQANAWGLGITSAGYTAVLVIGLWLHWRPIFSPTYVDRDARDAELHPTSRASAAEVVAIGEELAIEAAEHDLHLFCNSFPLEGVVWFDSSSLPYGETRMRRLVGRAVRYLELRDRLRRHPTVYGLVRVLP